MQPKTPTLYTPLMRQLRLLQMIEENDGEIPEEIEKEWDFSNGNVSERAERMIELRNAATMLIAQTEKEIEQKQAFVLAQKRTIGVLDKGLKSGVELLGPMQAGTYRLSLRKSPGSIIIADAALIPDIYRKPVVVPPTPEKGEPDKALIKKAIEDGNFVPGASLKKDSTLVIK